MEQWWTQKSQKESELNPQKRAVAYYRHSAQDKQENSILIQQEQVQAWAMTNDLKIIEEFSDAGKSGLNAEGRPAFMNLMVNWVKKRKDFKYVLCLDVSRWGRFPDIDLSATYTLPNSIVRKYTLPLEILILKNLSRLAFSGRKNLKYLKMATIHEGYFLAAAIHF